MNSSKDSFLQRSNTPKSTVFNWKNTSITELQEQEKSNENLKLQSRNLRYPLTPATNSQISKEKSAFSIKKEHLKHLYPFGLKLEESWKEGRSGSLLVRPWPSTLWFIPERGSGKPHTLSGREYMCVCVCVRATNGGKKRAGHGGREEEAGIRASLEADEEKRNPAVAGERLGGQ